MKALSYLQHVRRRANILLMASVMMAMLTVMFIVLSGTFARIIKAGQNKLANQQVAHVQQRVLQALRISSYNKFWDIRLNKPANTPMTLADVNQIIADTAQLLGVPQIQAGTAFEFPAANGKVNVTISAPFLPSSVPKPTGTTASAPIQPITGTGTWLDGTVARVHTIPVRINLTPGSGLGSTQEIQQTINPQILFCEIPQSSLAMMSEADMTGGVSGTTVTGPSRVKGTVASSANIQATGAFVYGQATGSGVTQRGTSQDATRSLTSIDPTNFRFQTEIKEYGVQESGRSGIIRQTQTQRVQDPLSILPVDTLYREGLANTVSGSLKSAYFQQPYYQVPLQYRVYGSHNPTKPPSDIFHPESADGGSNTDQASYSTWIPKIFTYRTAGGVLNTVFQVDITPLIATHNGLPLRIFVGAHLDPTLAGGSTTDFSRCFVMLQATPELQVGGAKPSSVTIVTPNTIVFQGEFNKNPANTAYVPVPTSLVAANVRFSFTAPSVLAFQGTVRGKQEFNNVISAKSADNTSTPTANIQLQAATSAAATADMDAGPMFYITLIRQS